MRTFFLLVYRLFVAPLGVLLAITVGAIFVPKIREGLRLRRIKREWPDFKERPIWIHASSGEFEYAKPFITELKSRRPQTPVVVTYFTPSFATAIARFPGVDFSLPLPVDLPGPTRGFLAKLKPRMGFIARTDLWPELLHQASALRISLVLFSVTKTRPPGVMSKLYQKWLFGYLTSVYCVSEDDVRFLRGSVANIPLAAIGDTRFDQVLARLRNPRPLRDGLKPEWSKTIVAGSTWSEDETVLLQALRTLLLDDRLCLILVPHEPTPSHIQSLITDLTKLGIPHVLYSKADRFSGGVLLVDQMGILAELYQWGAFAFVGGSFRKSVHSVMEPLAAGSQTWVGPYHRNNREAIDFQSLSYRGIPFVKSVRSSNELQELAEKSLAGVSDEFSKSLRAEIESRGGASRRLVETAAHFTPAPSG